jgi:leucyl aminopeptidase
MRYTTSTRPNGDDALDAIVVPVFAGGALPAGVAATVVAVAGVDLPAIASRLHPRELGDHAWVGARSDGPDLLLLCVGPAEDGEASEAGAEALRIAAMVAGRVVGRRRVASLLAAARPSDPGVAGLVAESWTMGAYRFDAYRPDPAPAGCEEVVMWGCDPVAVETGAVVGEATGLVRDLANTPGGDLPPLAFARRCGELGEQHGFTVRVVQGQELADGGFGGLVAVGAGSANPPVLIELERGARDQPHVALVGKGITFDSGGLSLKPSTDMLAMKGDMGGAAAIVGALVAADRLGLDTHVRAYLACAENMPGGSALRVGDVIRHRNGLTTEVVDTDCEGRLVLSDVLAYAAESAPVQLIDCATLSSRTGLGTDVWAVLGTDQALVGQLLAAGAAAGEPGWQLPLWDGYASRLASDTADLRNFDPSMPYPPNAVLAALYLRRFVADAPWAHVDLGVTTMRATATAAWRTGANGNGTRTLVHHLLRTARDDAGSGSVHHTAAEN